jgi:hypothetical protein
MLIGMKRNTADIIPFPGANQPLEIKLAELDDIIADLQMIHGMKPNTVMQAVCKILERQNEATGYLMDEQG